MERGHKVAGGDRLGKTIIFAINQRLAGGHAGVLVGQRTEVRTVAERTGGLGLFIRSLVGLDRAAAQAAFADYLDREQFTPSRSASST